MYTSLQFNHNFASFQNENTYLHYQPHYYENKIYKPWNNTYLHPRISRLSYVSVLLLMNQTTIKARSLEQIDIAFFTLHILDSATFWAKKKLLQIAYSLDIELYRAAN